MAGTIEIVVCLHRERAYFNSGHSVTLGQWDNGMVVNHPRAVVINEEIQKRVTEFEHILIAMQVNRDDMTIAQFKTYLGAEGGNRRNFMAWLRERIENRPLREGTRKGHITTYKALEIFGKFKTFDDVTLQHIYQFDLFIREEQTYTTKGKSIVRSQAAIHNYHKRFKSYVTEAFRLGLIKENPYERFQDKRGEKSDRPHLNEAQLKKLISIRGDSTDAVMNRYLDFFLFQTFTGMAYSDAKSFDYEKHVVEIEGKEYIDGHRMKKGNEFVTPILPITKRILERNNYKMEIIQPEVQSIPQRYRLGYRLLLPSNNSHSEAHFCVYSGSRSRYIKGSPANYDGPHLYQDNRNLCETTNAICVTKYRQQNVWSLEMKLEKNQS